MKRSSPSIVPKHFLQVRSQRRSGGNVAYYAMRSDRVQMPPFKACRDPKAYYSTLAHETHWTKHEKRVNRDFGRKRFGDEGICS